MHGVVGHDGDRCGDLLHRPARTRVEAVAVGLAIGLVLVPAIARSGHRLAVQRQHPWRGFGVHILFRCGFHQHAPRLAVRFAAVAGQFAADFDQRRPNPLPTQPGGYVIDAEALGDRREIQFQPARLQQRIILPLQALPTATLTGGLQGSGVGLAAFTGMCTEAPQCNQRTDGGIEGAVTGGSDGLCAGHNVAGLRRQHAPLASVGAVVAAQIRAGLPGAHLRDHVVQPRLDAGVQRVQVALARRDQRHAPGGAHGGATEAGDVEMGIGHGDALRWRCRGMPGIAVHITAAALPAWRRSSGGAWRPASPTSCCPRCRSPASTCRLPARSP